MNVGNLLHHIDNGYIALPEFQRGYVWNRDQVRALMQSLYRGYPVGSLLVWVTRSDFGGEVTRGDGPVAPGVVKLLLDGQQRITSLYGIIRGRPPAFFDGNAQAFTGLHFHLESETFEFYAENRMSADPLWVDVTALMQAGNDGIGALVAKIGARPEAAAHLGDYFGRLSKLLAIRDRIFPVEEVTDGVARPGEDVLDVVVDIFNRVNSGGTKLSKGDLALARICAEAPDARDRMKNALAKWRGADFHFDLDWLLRCVNTVIKGEAKFHFLHKVSADEFRDGLERAERAIDWCLNAISGRLGLDHDRVLFGRYAMPVLAHYLDRQGGTLSDPRDRDRLLFWYLHAAMWGRFSGNTETNIDRDLELIERLDGGVDRLIEELRLWRGGLRVAPAHFTGWSLGARFYPILYLLTRTQDARDWGNGLPLKMNLLGKMNHLEVHHIFPKSRLYKKNFRKSDVNAVANYCFLTKDTNLKIGSRLPEDYFPEVEERQPGALASQWIPMDERLWRVENYLDYLEARRELLADASNNFLAELLHEDVKATEVTAEHARPLAAGVLGGVESEAEEAELEALNAWVVEQGLPEGQLNFELAEEQGNPIALLDLAWPRGLQPGYSKPVAVLLNEGPETLALANRYGFDYFTSCEDFRRHVAQRVLAIASAK